MITVISTGCGPVTREKCRASVRGQVGVEFDHVVLDAAEQHPPRPPMINLIDAVADLPDERIVVHLDLDDWLARRDALLIVERMHHAGAWLTYGSFEFADGRFPQWMGPYKPGEDVRRSQWRGSHLKTFRAGLFRKIKPSDLMLDGLPIEHARDLAAMFPMIEMAGQRAVFCPAVLAIYNYGSSTEFTGDEAVWEAERRCVAHVRGLPAYAEIGEL